MKRLDAWLTDDCFAAHLIGHLHSTFSSVLNIKFGDRIITFSQRRGLPDSIAVDREVLSLLRDLSQYEVIEKRGKSFFVNGEHLFDTVQKNSCFRLNVNASEFLQAHKKLEETSGYTNGFMVLPPAQTQTVIQNLKALAAACYRNDVEEIFRVLPQCIGFGKGLTPSSDDAVIGILFAAYYGAVPPFFKDLREYRILDELTNEISLKYLYCAFESRFSKPLADLSEIGIREIYNIGSTSGADLLFGMKLAFEELIC